MPTDTKIILLDLPTALPQRRSISPFTSRVRYILNYKQLSYTTQWVEFPDIEPTLRKLGVQPTTIRNGSKADGTQRYTLPVIIDETDPAKGRVIIADSLDIVKYLETTYPDSTRPIFSVFHPSSEGSPSMMPAIHVLAGSYLSQTIFPVIRPFILPLMYKIQTPASEKAWLARAANGSVENLPSAGLPGSKEREEAWKRTRETLDGIASFFDHNRTEGAEGEWLMGANPTFADFVLLSFLMMVRAVSPDELWVDVKTWSGGKWGRYVDAAEPWLVVH